jgi:hypothetical protein
MISPLATPVIAATVKSVCAAASAPPNVVMKENVQVNHPPATLETFRPISGQKPRVGDDATAGGCCTLPSEAENAELAALFVIIWSENLVNGVVLTLPPVSMFHLRNATAEFATRTTISDEFADMVYASFASLHASPELHTRYVEMDAWELSVS